MEQRRCGRCDTVKPGDEFSPRNRWCKLCRREYNAKRYAEKPDRQKAASARWKDKRPDYRAEYYLANKESMDAKSREQRQANPEYFKAYAAEYYQKNKAKKDARAAEWRRTHPERMAELGQQYRAANPRKVLDARLRKLYKLTLDDYEAMLTAQGGGCAICGGPSTVASHLFSVDHDHETGEVRGLLCKKCNTGIGQLGDDPALLAKAIDYLNAYRQGRK